MEAQVLSSYTVLFDNDVQLELLNELADRDSLQFIPNAVRRLVVETPQLAYRCWKDDWNYNAWKVLEERRARIDAVYWACNYGAMRPKVTELHPVETIATGWAPFDPYDWQIGFMTDLEFERYLAFLKTRQAGGTTTVEQIAAHGVGIAKGWQGSTTLITSVDREKAAERVENIHTILDLQPPWLRPAIGPVKWDVETGEKEPAIDPITGKPGVDQAARFSCPERGSNLRSTSASGSGSRGIAARRYISDESAAPPKSVRPERWLAGALPVIKGGGQVVFLSTGDGDEYTKRQGRTFAKIVRQLQRGEFEGKLVFLSRDQDPSFSQEDYDNTASLLGQDVADQEYPLTIDQALQGESLGRSYVAEHITAAVELGRKFKARYLMAEGLTLPQIFERVSRGPVFMGEEQLPALTIEDVDQWLMAGALPEPELGEIWGGIDWGVNSRAVYCYPMGGHVRYIVGEEVATKANLASPEVFSRRFYEKATTWEKKGISSPQLNLYTGVRLTKAFYDGSNPTAAASLVDARPRDDIDVVGVNFNPYRGLTIPYIRTLFRRTFEGASVGIIAIDPDLVANLQKPGLGQELYNLENGEDGLPAKGDDHSQDALISLLGTDGDAWRSFSR